MSTCPLNRGKSRQLRVNDAERLQGMPGRVGDAIWVSSISAARTSMHSDYLTMYFNWNVVAPFGEDVDTIIEVRDEQNTPIATYQGYALEGMSAPRLWQPGDRISDSMMIPVPDNGRYSVWVGLQKVGSGERLPVYDTKGEPSIEQLLNVGDIEIVGDSMLPVVSQAKDGNSLFRQAHRSS